MIPASISFANGAPFSSAFGDIYFNPAQACDEVTHVFLNGNNLAERMARATDRLVIAETGFGTGLNCLMAADLFLRLAPLGTRLSLISVEAYPLRHTDLTKALAPFRPRLPKLVDRLIAEYPLLIGGFHRLWLDPRIDLTLIFADAAAGLAQVGPKRIVDAWFLDGFAPSKNPAMWSDGLFQAMADLSHGTTTLASFTSAGMVRRGLADHGFIIERRKGFGHKRHMITGTTQLCIPRHPANPTPRPVTIHGAGFGGVALACALGRRGHDITLVDPNGAAAGASGNSIGLYNPKLTAAPSLLGQMAQAGFSFLYRRLQDSHDHAWRPTGVLQLAGYGDDDQAARLEKISHTAGWHHDHLQLVTPDDIHERLGVRVNASCGLWLPQAGQIIPKQWIQRQISALGIDCHRTPPPNDRQNPDHLNLWAIGAHATARWPNLPLRLLRGQTTRIRLALPPTYSRPPWPCATTYGGYASALDADGLMTLGASFQPTDNVQPQIYDQDDHDTLAKFGLICPDLAQYATICDHWAGVRVTTPHHLPIAALVEPSGWVVTGLGSHGLLYAPLVAEIVADHIAGTPWPVPQNLANKIILGL